MAAPQTPTGVPTAVVAGDTWRWRIADPVQAALQPGDPVQAFSNADGWALSFRILGEDEPVDATCSLQTSGDDDGYWLVTVSATASDLAPGTYRLIGKLTGSGDTAGRVHTIINVPLDVARNPATADAADFQSQAAKDLAAIVEVCSNRITADLEGYTVAGRQITKIPIRDLWALRRALEDQVRRERTGQLGRPVNARFSHVTS